MVQKKADSIKGYKEMNVPFTEISKVEGSKKLAILLPGLGYTVQSPLLHYSMGVMLNKGFDVLQVNYQYNNKAYDAFSNEEIREAVKFDVKTVITHFLDDKEYEDYYFIGKSFGTIAMSSELNRDIFSDAKAIWLTPLLHNDDVFNAMVNSKHRGLCFIGDNDQFYIEERYKEVTNNENITSRLIPDVDHSLEYDSNVDASIDVLRQVIYEIEQF